MKRIKLILAFLTVISFIACDKEDSNVYNEYDNVNGQTGLGFSNASGSVVVPVDGQITYTIGVQATNLSSSDRTFNVTADTENSVGDAGDYSVGTAVIPADSYFGTLEVTFFDDELVDLAAYSVILNLDIPEGVAAVGSRSFTVNYNRYLVCNDLVLTINDDFYSDERTWEVTDSDGNVVVSGGPYPQTTGGGQFVENFYLDDGCYTFTIYDSYGDGQFDGDITGNYSLDCSIINHASGTGNWGFSDSTDFCVNP